MAKQNRTVLKTFFNSGDRPSEGEFSDLIDSGLNAIEDKATTAEVELGTNDDKYVTPLGAKASVLKFTPVVKVNGVSPDSSGDIIITNVSGTATTISGSITKSQVTGLEADLNAKQAQLVSGSNIKTINGTTLLGSGDIAISGGGGGQVKIIGVPSAAFTLANSATAQNAFPASCDTFTLGANKTYFFKGTYLITFAAITPTRSIAMSWLAGGGLTTSSVEYVAQTFSAAASIIATSLSSVQVTGIASKVINAANGSLTSTIMFEGIIRTLNGGTITPQINFSTVQTGANQMKVGSFIEFTEIGNNTVEAIGTVG